MSQNDCKPTVRRALSFGLFELLLAVTAIALLLICIRVAYARGYADGREQAASEAVTPEIYYVGDIVQSEAGFKFIDGGMTDEIEPASWSPIGGPGHDVFFALNQMLIVQTPRIHEAIRKEFTRLRAEMSQGRLERRAKQ